MKIAKFRLLTTNLIPLIIVSGFVISGLYSCSDKKYDALIRQNDDIIQHINAAQRLLIIDNQNIVLRIDSMKRKVSFLDSLDKSRMNSELLLDYSSYKALLKNYERFTDKYVLIEFDNESLRKQALNLKQQLIDAAIKPSVAQTKADSLESLSIAHYQACKKSVEKIISQERLYQRKNVKLGQFITSLKNNNSE